jgi:hypothetical protein
MGNFVKFCQILQGINWYVVGDTGIKTHLPESRSLTNYDPGEKPMNIRSLIRMMFVLMMILGLASCQTQSTQPPTQATSNIEPISDSNPPTDPNSEIVLSMIERLNAGDVDGSLSYFDDKARVYLIGLPPTGIEYYYGVEQIRALWEDSVDNHFQWEVEIATVSANEVNLRTKTWHDFTRQIEVAPLEYFDVYELRDGKIVTYGSWLTRESLDRFKPAFEKVVPPEPMATTVSAPPVSEFTVTIADGTCFTDNPISLKVGEVAVNLSVQDQEKSLYALTLFSIDPKKDILDLMVSTVGSPPTWGDILLLKEIEPGASQSYNFEIDEGYVYMVCWSQPPDMPIGNAGPIPVVP